MDGNIVSWILLICAILLALYGLYFLVKKAVKDAIREIQKEERNNQK